MNPIADIVSGASNGLREIVTNKVRSLLSMSGIILGVAALVTMVGIVQGMLSNLRGSFEAEGGILKVEVIPKVVEDEQKHIAGRSPGLTMRDVQAIRQATHLVDKMTPTVDMNWSYFVGGGRRRGGIVDGVGPEFNQIQTREILHGRWISDLDMENKAPVVVVGSYIAEALFKGQENVVGETVRIHDQIYTIIGQTEELVSMVGGENVLRWKNRRNYVPATTGIARYQGTDTVERIELLAGSLETMPDMIEQVENILTQTHRGIIDFELRTQEERLQELRKLENSFLYSLGGIAAISLLVGGIGIMNVMLASVSERIREIGVRKAIGARSHDIFIQFLAEAVVISILGGLLGLVLSLGLLSVAKDLIPAGEAIQVVPISAMLFGFAFSTAVGLLSGIYPAMRAGRLDPIDALRYE